MQIVMYFVIHQLLICLQLYTELLFCSFSYFLYVNSLGKVPISLRVYISVNCIIQEIITLFLRYSQSTTPLMRHPWINSKVIGKKLIGHTDKRFTHCC